MSTFTDTHTTDQELVSDGTWTTGARGTCTCGWRGPTRSVHSAAPARDLLEHCNEMKERTT
jgi:hypothetical protein